MLGRSHAVLGGLAGAVTAHAAEVTTTPGILVCVTLGGLAGLAPDLDHPNSLLGRHLPGWWHRATPGHRGVTYSIAWTAGVGGLAAFAAAQLGIHRHGLVGLVVAVGIGTHLAGDALTRQGVPWVWPLSKRRFALPAPLAITTGGWAERLIVVALVAAGSLYLTRSWARLDDWAGNAAAAGLTDTLNGLIETLNTLL